MSAPAVTASVRAILLDIEGTTSSIRFVYDVLFPFVRQRLTAFLDLHWDDADIRAACERVAQDAGGKSLADWCGATADRNTMQRQVTAEVLRLMDGDVKATGLKELQGLIWREGYDSGTLVSHVYADLPPALADWQRRGIDVRIYSSGSIAAQKLFFAHTEHGNLLPFFRGHYDTTTGPKREAESYRIIAAAMNLPPESILFCSDIPAELDAAHTAGMQTRLVMRPGNAPVDDSVSHARIMSFAEIAVA